MLGRDNGFDNGSEVVDIGQRLDAEEDIVEGSSGSTGCFFRCPDD